MRIFNSIKKSRRESSDIDEKIEYLNKELEKTGLHEVAANSTSGVYVGSETNPNEKYAEFTAKNFNGVPFAMSGDPNLGQGSVGSGSIRASDGAALSPDGTTTQTKGGIGSGGFKLAIPGERKTPEHRMTGPILWYWTGSSWGSLEYNSPEVHGGGVYPGNAAGWGYWGSNFLGFPMLRSDGAAFASLFTTLNDSDGNQFDPNTMSNPTTTVLTQNKLDDPDFIPINIDGMSPQGFEWLKERAKQLAKKYGRKYQGANDPFWDDFVDGFPEIPAGDEDPNTRKGSGMGDRWIGPPVDKVDASGAGSNDDKPYDPFANEAKPNLGAKPGDKLAGFFGDSPEEKAAKELKKVVDKGRSGMLYNKTLQFAHQAASGQNYGTASNPRDEAAFIKKFKITPQQFLKYAASGDVKHLKDIQVDNILNQSYQPEGNVLSENVKLGHFEPDQLNVDIEDLRKGIMPEFPKDPPPEMENGYNPNSRLAPKKLDPAPFIKVTRKDLAQNHKLTDKEITEFMNDIKMVNEYIKENPADLIYAQTRYPKHDPRLAQLNWQMDQMLGASKEYVDKQYPENQKLFKKVQTSIKKNIELTDPKSFKDVKVPKFKGVDLTDFKRRKEVVSRHYKKAVKVKSLFNRKKT